MRSKKIDAAFARIAPDDETRGRILEQVLQNASIAPVKRARPLRRGILIAACVALLAAGLGGYAAYQKWKLPKPETYEPTEHGKVSVHSVEEYTGEQIEAGQPVEPLSDEDFIQRSVQVLELIGMSEVDTSKMTVSRHEDMYWSREEAEVLFTEDAHQASVKFNAKTGALIGLTGWELLAEPETQPQQSPDTIARHYYELLPVPQNYELTHVEKYDEQAWSYDFCRKVSEDLYNQYEMVRIGINPLTGLMYQLVVFDVPLLDDHEPGDVPVTKEQADEIARACNSVDLSQYELESAEVTCVFPNWHFSDYPIDGNLRASAVSRLGWMLVYSRESEFDDKILLDIDYYTGEILGGDVTA